MKINRKRWQIKGSFETLDNGLRSVWIDKTESHPYRGVYLAAVGAPADVYGNPSGLRDAPIGAYAQVGRIQL
jgi:hypothetical protein